MQKFTVLVTGTIPGDGLSELFRQCRVFYPEKEGVFSEEEMLRLLPECDAVLALGAVTREMIERAPHLKIISNYGAGYDRVDVSAATEHGVWVTNIPDATARPTAELALTLMLDVLRRVTELDRRIRSAQRKPSDSFGKTDLMGHTLCGKRLGIVGMGRIGSLLADWTSMLGMEVSYHNRHDVAGSKYRFLPLETLLSQSDVVSVNCPLTPETRGMLSREKLSLMREGAVFINTARGAVADYDALCDMLTKGRIAGAGLDVFPEEPDVPGALLSMENVVLTPHIGTHTHEARTDMARAAAQKILDVASGVRPSGIVNAR